MLKVVLSVIGIVLSVIGVAMFTNCKSAGKADDYWEKKWEDKRKQEEKEKKAEIETKLNESEGRVEGYKWCDDECLRCEQNDWCRFSEVKK